MVVPFTSLEPNKRVLLQLGVDEDQDRALVQLNCDLI